MTEFEVIQKYFSSRAGLRDDVRLGPGDDAAVLAVPQGVECIYSCDTLVGGQHFQLDAPPRSIGHKALAVSLSDCAAMGASPAWISGALTLPAINEVWLAEFSDGFFELMETTEACLIGGDLTEGPLSITLGIHGLVPQGKALMRSGARVGDSIYVTGTLGGAGLAFHAQQHTLILQQSDYQSVLSRLQSPQPRVQEGLALQGVAHAAIDISDGLAADLQHVLTASGCGARIELAALPVDPVLTQFPKQHAWTIALSSGDDYELCFTLPADREAWLKQHWDPSWAPYHRIGHITATRELSLVDAEGQPFILEKKGHQHFA